MTKLAANKVCPVVLRRVADVGTQILVFRHPLAGVQLVKGTIEHGEVPRAAALRELWEESGLFDATVAADLGLWDLGEEAQVWSFHLCIVRSALADRWTHRAADDGGHDFHFFWHTLTQQPSADWHPWYPRALLFIRQALRTVRTRHST